MDTEAIKGKKILLVAPAYYGYERYIVEELKSLGADVQFYENKSFQHDPNNKGTAWYKQILCKKSVYINGTLAAATHNSYDVCIFINLFSFHPRLIENLKKSNPKIECILYLWDNIKGYKWQQYFKHFQSIYTFDPVEALQFKIKYLPNFFVSANGLGHQVKYELSSIGSFQAHRIRLLATLIKKLSAENKSSFFYLYLPVIYRNRHFTSLKYIVSSFFKKRFKSYRHLHELVYDSSKNSILKNNPLTLHHSILVTIQSRCIIDLPYPEQTGSTHRVIQALAHGKKIITTNQSIKSESFYNPDYINIQSVDNFSIDWKWLDQPITSTIDMNSLRIDNWLTTLLSNEVHGQHRWQ
jgi:hypothetical protein